MSGNPEDWQPGPSLATFIPGRMLAIAFRSCWRVLRQCAGRSSHLVGAAAVPE